MPLPSFKMRSRWPLYMVLIYLTKSICLNLLRNWAKIDLNFGEMFHSSGSQRWDIIWKHSFTVGSYAFSLPICPWNCCSLHCEHLCLQKLDFWHSHGKDKTPPFWDFGKENGHPSPSTSDHTYKICLWFSFLQRAYTEEELNAKLTRRVQKAARRQAKQEELKRLHRAQVASQSSCSGRQLTVCESTMILTFLWVCQKRIQRQNFPLFLHECPCSYSFF